jgi:hypothetical protein
MADAAEALRTRGELGLEYGRNPITQAQIDCADDARSGAQVAVAAARTFRRDALHELGFADNPEFFWTPGTIH